MDSFADAPLSISELRSEKSGLAKDLTVRDMLIRALRDIDSGDLKADFAVLCICERARPGDTPATIYSERRLAGPHNHFELVGLVDEIKSGLKQ